MTSFFPSLIKISRRFKRSFYSAWEASKSNLTRTTRGSLGFYAAALAKHFGCRKIIVTAILDHRLEFIKSFGAADTPNTRDMTDEQVVEAVRVLASDFGEDGAMEVADVLALIPIGLKCFRIGRRFIEIGNFFPGAIFTYEAYDIVLRRLIRKGIHSYDTKQLQMGWIPCL